MAEAIPTPPSNHILPALVLLRKPLSGLAKRRISVTLCEIWVKISWECIDNKEKDILKCFYKGIIGIMKRKYNIEQIRPFVEQFIKDAKIEFCGSGDDSEAFCVNNKFVFKFPKHENANDCLNNEINLLKQIQNIFEIEIPNVLFEGEFKVNSNNFIFFVSKKLEGNNLSKNDFLTLEPYKLEKAAKTIAKFLKTLHLSSRQKLKNDFVLLHGDFSLNHILFQDGEISGILDFADNCFGKYEQDFVYLLDNEDPEEFGKTFGETVLKYYLE